MTDTAQVPTIRTDTSKTRGSRPHLSHGTYHFNTKGCTVSSLTFIKSFIQIKDSKYLKLLITLQGNIDIIFYVLYKLKYISNIYFIIPIWRTGEKAKEEKKGVFPFL